jgi:hypothetical protein
VQTIWKGQYFGKDDSWLSVGKAGKTGPAAQDFAPVYPLSLDPVLWGLAVSFAIAIVVSLLTAPLPDKHVDKYFLADPSA